MYQRFVLSIQPVTGNAVADKAGARPAGSKLKTEIKKSRVASMSLLRNVAWSMYIMTSLPERSGGCGDG